MEDDHKNQETVELLEDNWFFGNSLKKKGKMVRCNSDPVPSSKKEEVFGPKKNAAQSSNLLRTPSLPQNLGKELPDWSDEEDGPRMGDLIRQAMPCKLSRSPSLPPCMIKMGPTMSKKLTRRSSLDPYSKGKESQQRRSDMLKSRNLERSMSLKNLSDREVKGFQDLGFKFAKEDLSPSVVSKLSGLSIKEEPDEEGEEDMRRNKNSWVAKELSYSSTMPKWVGSKSSAKDMKAQIKFWARAVASNVRQEC